MFKKTDIADVYSLSPMQEGILFHYLLEPKSTAYIIQMDFIVHGTLHLDLVEKSLSRLIQQYDILRTVFMSRKVVKPRQVVLKSRQASLCVRDISSLDQDRQARFLEDFKQNDREKGFNLARDIPLRISIIQASAQRFHIIWTTHHIIMDGWCLGILSKNLLLTYQALKNGKPLPDEPVIPYKHYIHWLEGQDKEEGLAYWKRYLDGYDHKASLPRLFKQPAPDRYELRKYQFSLTPGITAGIGRIARANKVTINTVFQTLWGLLLQQYNHTRDVVFGIIVSGRPPGVRGIESMVGLFVNNVPMRVKRDSTCTFSQLARDIYSQEAMSKSHEYLPLAEIQSQSRLKQDTIDHIISFANYPIQEELRKEGLEEKLGFQIESTKNFEQTTYDLDISVTPGENLSIRFCFNALVYAPDLMEFVASHFKEMARQVVENPDLDADRVGKVPAAARQEFLSRLNRELETGWNRVCKNGNVLQAALQKSLARYKNNTAIEYGNHCITYEELERRSNYIANWFLARGIPRETFTGILIEDRMEIALVVMGILKAGNVFVPLETKHPVDRLKQMIHSSGIPLVVTDIPNFNRFGPLPGVEFIPAEELLGNIENKEPSGCIRDPGAAYRPKDIIYIYFTSGTTGTPRAFAGMNTGLLHFIQWEIHTLGMGEGFRVSQLISPGFDAFLRDIFAPLAAGGVICIPRSGEVISSPRQLVQWLESSGVNLVHCGPSLFRAMNSHPLTRGNLKELQYILLSGEPVIPHELASWYAIFADRIKLVNLWGTSETTLAKTCYFIQPSDVHRERVPVGKPIPGASVVVVDEQMNLCPPLVCGDLYIVTPFRTHGYCNAPGLNRQQFIPNPFNPRHHYPWHKTGDFGMILIDGNINVMGRTDRQVKIRGIRVELAEIESIMMKHPNLEEVVVVNKEITVDNTCIYAYVTLDHGNHREEELLLADINSFLSGKLPDYMRPTQIIIMDEIPRNPNGKVDYRQLPDPLSRERKMVLAPRDGMEKTLVELWSEILKIEKEKIGVTDRFFELGGNSLNIMSLNSKIHMRFNVKISLREIYNHPTVEMQAAIIKTLQQDRYTPLQMTEEKEYYELSSAQKRLYILHQAELERIGTAYNISRVVVMKGTLHRDKLENIFKEMIKRHESFRTSFEMVADRPVQRIHDHCGLDFAIGYHQAEPGQYLPLLKHLIKPFNLALAPLMRVDIITTGDDNHILIVDMHHITADGRSMALLIQEFMQSYGNRELPLLDYRYRDYTEWQNKEDKQGTLKNQENFWLKEFPGEIPVLELPTDYARPRVQVYEGNSLNSSLGKEESEKLKALAAGEEATMFMIWLAVFNVLLSKISGQEDIVVGVGIEGRRHENLRRIIGMFVNTLAIRSFPQKDKSFIEFLREIKEKTLNAFENQDYQFEDLVKKVASHRESSRNPLFDVMFQYENIDIPEVEIPGLQLHDHSFKKPISKFDITLRAMDAGDIFLYNFEYSTALFETKTIEGMARYFHEIILSVLNSPHRTLSDIGMDLVKEDRETINQYTGNLEVEF